MRARKHTIDPRAVAAYPIAEAARYLRLPAATLRAWTLGRDYPTAGGTGRSKPVISLAAKDPPQLSFWNLIEAHVLRALRTEHGVPMDSVRRALAYAERTLNVGNLLRSPELRTKGGELFLDRYGQIINLSASGQLAMRHIFDEHLKRIEWDAERVPSRLYPFLTAITDSGSRSIVIDPHRAFGRPIIARAGISTRAIIQRLDAGERIKDLERDYDLSAAEIQEAVVYERAA